MTPNAYEQRVLLEIDRFKNPKRGLFAGLSDITAAPLEKMSEYASQTAVGKAVTGAVSGVVSLLNDGASWSVRQEAIFSEFRKDGHHSVRTFEDIRKLDLEDVDKTVGYLAAKYKSVAFVEGGVTGVLGAPGIAADVPAVIGLALRACNEYAAYYGFNPEIQAERAFVMNVLSAASSPTNLAKQAAMTEVTRISVMIGQRKTWQELEKILSVQLIRRIAEALGIRLTKGKLGQIIPLFGAAVGAGYNAWYVSQVAETASVFYRERFLIEKYGVQIVVPVRP